MSRPVKAEHSPAESPLPGEGVGYTDYLLRAPSRSEYRYNIMKFAALGDKSINPASDAFLKPVKLNRKNPQTVRRLTEDDRERINHRALAAAAKASAEAEAAARVARGEPPEGIDSLDSAVNAEEGAGAGGGDVDVKVKDSMDVSLVGAGVNGVVRQRNKNNLFKKATKRVFVTSEEARRLKREEYMPWVLEDDEGNSRWIGALEGGTGAAREGTAESQRRAQHADKSGTGTSGWRRSVGQSGEAGGGGSSYVALVLDGEGEFSVVPVTRWYKFTKGPEYLTLDPDEAEQHYERLQKSTETERWLMRRKFEPSTSTPASSAAPRGAEQSSIRARLLANSEANARASTSSSRPKGGLKSVIKGSAGGDGDDELRGRKGRRDAGDEQGDDEFDYEEDFQDDEEGIAKIDDFADEDETKELEERIKKEMRAANNIEDVPEVDDDDDDFNELTGTGKELRRLVKKRDKTGAYDSDNDDELNPYASEVETDDDSASIGSADINAVPDTNNPPPRIQQLSASDSRPRSQSSNSQGKHSRQHSKSHPASRSGSPGAGSTSGSALIAKRATSPARSRGGSPGPGGKRKRDEGDSDGSKRKRSGASTPEPSAAGDGSLISEQDLVELFKSKPALSTKEVLSHFKKQLKADPRNKANIGALLRQVADLTDAGLVLKPGL